MAAAASLRRRPAPRTRRLHWALWYLPLLSVLFLAGIWTSSHDAFALAPNAGGGSFYENFVAGPRWVVFAPSPEPQPTAAAPLGDSAPSEQPKPSTGSDPGGDEEENDDSWGATGVPERPSAVPSQPPPPVDLTGWVDFEPPRAKAPRQVDTSSIGAFVETGGRLPILLVTCDRPVLLKETLASLLSVRGVTKRDIIVVQDASNPSEGVKATAQVVADMGVPFHQKTEMLAKARLRGADGAMRIAQHYGYALRYALEQAAPTSPGVIVLEDDFLFSPDLYEYFHAVAPIVEQDPTVFTVSSWNDNGQDRIVSDPAALRRTEFFPGLGWFMPRQLWERELGPKWPRTHWDHWLRSRSQHKDRDIVYPEVPRGYHIGLKGTFMDRSHHDKFFRRIALHADATFRWTGADGHASEALEAVKKPAWKTGLAARVAAAEKPTSFEKFEALSTGKPGKDIVLFYTVRANFQDNFDFRKIATYFGCWHEPQRGSWHGVTLLAWPGGRSVILVDDGRRSEHGIDRPKGLTLFKATDFANRRPATIWNEPAASSGGLVFQMPMDKQAVEDAVLNQQPLLGPDGALECPWSRPAIPFLPGAWSPIDMAASQSEPLAR